MKTKLTKQIQTVALGAAVMLFTDFQSHGQGMPGELRSNIHELFNKHGKVTRTVTETPKGYVSVTETDDPALRKVLREHIHQMEDRLKSGLGVRMWDPAFQEYRAQLEDISLKITPTDKGVRVEATGATEQAIQAARVHAQVVSAFVANGWEEHDKTHPVPNKQPKEATERAAKPGGNAENGRNGTNCCQRCYQHGK